MLIVNRSPLNRTIDQLHNEVSSLLSSVLPSSREPSPSLPPVNIWEDDANFFIEAELPGFSMEKLEISVLGELVTVKGERETASAQRGQYLRRERSSGKFERTVALPAAVDSESVRATLRDGVLLVRLPKAAVAMPRRIQVNAS